jgi:hypothetical protein
MIREHLALTGSHVDTSDIDEVLQLDVLAALRAAFATERLSRLGTLGCGLVFIGALIFECHGFILLY